MARTRKLFAALTRRGRHQVLRGDLAFAGLAGTVYTPASGFNLPGVAFGHDWLTDVDHYLKTLEHLASWGIVAAAPSTERGLAPSVLNMAVDLGTTLEIITGVRLGPGEISVHPTKLGLAGHGFGGSAAVFAAAGLSGAGARAPKAVAALFPSVTKPPAAQPAASLKTPGLVLSAPDDAISLRTDALDLTSAWKGSVLRIVSKAESAGLAEKRRLAGAVGLPGSDRRTQKTTRALLTGFLLYHLTGDKAYKEFADPEAVLPKTEILDPEAPPVTPEEQIVALLK
ncbi:dienelactone hydrolase family protein [Mycolicibacterium sp. Dal123E01]|uniref:dienelactone hydrolase family protein n=1 Tax=Mycolicibacterium sp. Dal123E01 TaxID=3457578 RepID=UPI00403E9906